MTEVRAAVPSRNAPFVDRYGRLTSQAYRQFQTAGGLITADRIVAGAIETESLASGAVTTVKLAANAVTADKASFNTLSAVTTNFGNANFDGVIKDSGGTTIEIDFTNGTIEASGGFSFG